MLKLCFFYNSSIVMTTLRVLGSKNELSTEVFVVVTGSLKRLQSFLRSPLIFTSFCINAAQLKCDKEFKTVQQKLTDSVYRQILTRQKLTALKK